MDFTQETKDLHSLSTNEIANTLIEFSYNFGMGISEKRAMYYAKNLNMFDVKDIEATTVNMLNLEDLKVFPKVNEFKTFIRKYIKTKYASNQQDNLFYCEKCFGKGYIPVNCIIDGIFYNNKLYSYETSFDCDCKNSIGNNHLPNKNYFYQTINNKKYLINWEYKTNPQKYSNDAIDIKTIKEKIDVNNIKEFFKDVKDFYSIEDVPF